MTSYTRFLLLALLACILLPFTHARSIRRRHAATNVLDARLDELTTDRTDEIDTISFLETMVDTNLPHKALKTKQAAAAAAAKRKQRESGQLSEVENSMLLSILTVSHSLFSC